MNAFDTDNNLTGNPHLFDPQTEDETQPLDVLNRKDAFPASGHEVNYHRNDQF